MTSSQFFASEFPADRDAQVQRIIDDCLERRATGQMVSDAEILAAHPALHAELERELRKLALIQQARRRAESTHFSANTAAPAITPPDAPRDTRRAATPAQAADTAANTDDPAAELTHALPGYRLIREIHRGGQGVVYEAVQLSTKRSVAVKVLHEGPFAGPADRLRFEREVEVLATLQHPHIVKIHDSGVAAGHFYYVMDHILGQTLDVWMEGPKNQIPSDKRKLEEPGAVSPRPPAPRPLSPLRSVPETLRLFLTICEAVHAAHLRGVIHRDLKPANILVDAEDRPHVLDFGLAKRTQGDDAAQAKLTQTRDFLGTPIYASPEQARGANHEVDVRSDVFALGVVLFEMLTGRPPYAPTLDLGELLRAIQQAEPPRPSALRFDIDRDLDIIVRKALRKEQAERYQSVDAFAADVRRYLAGEAVLAHPPSMTYQLRKFVRRNQVAVGGAVGFVLLLCLFSIFGWTLYVQAEGARREETRQRQRADTERDTARRAQAAERVQREAAETAQRQTEREAGKLRAVNDFLVQMLGAPNPYIQGKDVKVVDVLAQASARIAALLHDQPESEAAVRVAIGSAYQTLGLFAEAEPHFRAALPIYQKFRGDEAPPTLDAQLYLAINLVRQGKQEEAGMLLQKTLDAARRTLGDNELTLTAMNNLAEIWRGQHKLAEAETLLREALALHDRILPPNSPLSASIKNNLARTLSNLGRQAEADALLAQTQNVNWGDVPPDNPSAVIWLNNRAAQAYEQGQLAEAERLWRQAAEICLRALDANDPLTQKIFTYLAVALVDQGKLADAEASWRKLLALAREKWPPASRQLGDLLSYLSVVLVDENKVEEALPLLQEALTIYRAVAPPDDLDLALHLVHYGRGLTLASRPVEAEPLFREALIRLQKCPAEERHFYHSARSILGGCLAAQGRYAEAEALLLESYAALKDNPNVRPARLNDARERIRQLYETWNAAEPGKGYAEKAAAWREEKK